MDATTIIKTITKFQKDLEEFKKQILAEYTPAPPPVQVESDPLKEQAVEIMKMCNEALGSDYGVTAKKNLTPIMARLREGRTVNDFRTVINHLYQQWGKDEKMCMYLRPETMFGNKFAGYLNAARIKGVKDTPKSYNSSDIEEEILRRIAI